ncbi:hypothetical protein WSM22_11800 [Cytophagales bacterium WSM2-2]|nr:hypothetical protein WSM22_11800 [Cytophagales bacterium WSM2-2]
MDNLQRNIQPASHDPDQVEIEKYISLIHILKGQEEFVLNKDGIIIGSNLEAVNITGYEEYEVLNKHISILYTSEEKDKAKVDLKKAEEMNQVFVTGLRIKKKGVAFWAKMKIERVYSPEEDGPRFKVILKDATHRELSKARIRTIKDEYLALFNNPFVGTFKFRMEDYRLKVCNQKALEIINSQNLQIQYFDNFFYSSDQFRQFKEILSKEKKVEGFRFLINDHKNDGKNWGVISARYFESQGFVEGIIMDISEQHTQMLELQRVNAELDNFTYRASHDLRAPLTSIMGLVNLGMKEESIENIHQYLSLILGRVNHLDALLGDLVSVSLNNQAISDTSNFDFKEEVNSIVDSIQKTESTKSEITVKQYCDFRTDAARMRIILRHLLVNAFQYFRPDEDEHIVNARIYVDSYQVVIVIDDNGIGIDQGYRERVFEMFFKATDRSRGNGLGLYIVKSMVEKMGGQVFFESTPDVGSTFHVIIPNNRKNPHKTLKETTAVAANRYNVL